MIVADGVYDDFLREFTAAMSSYVTGDPTDPATSYGPLSSDRQARNLMTQIDDPLVSKGRNGHPRRAHRIDGPGAFVEATVLSGVTPDMRAYREELFGPAAVVYRVAGADEAVDLANSSAFGLGGAVLLQRREAGRGGRRPASTSGWPGSTVPRHRRPGATLRRHEAIRCRSRRSARLGIDEFVNKKLIHTPPAAQ